MWKNTYQLINKELIDEESTNNKNMFLHNNFKDQKINFKKVKYLKKDLQEITYLKNSFRLFFKQL
jgi:hypothetical protein